MWALVLGAFCEASWFRLDLIQVVLRLWSSHVQLYSFWIKLLCRKTLFLTCSFHCLYSHINSSLHLLFCGTIWAVCAVLMWFIGGQDFLKMFFCFQGFCGGSSDYIFVIKFLLTCLPILLMFSLDDPRIVNNFLHSLATRNISPLTVLSKETLISLHSNSPISAQWCICSYPEGQNDHLALCAVVLGLESNLLNVVFP